MNVSSFDAKKTEIILPPIRELLIPAMAEIMFVNLDLFFYKKYLSASSPNTM